MSKYAKSLFLVLVALVTSLTLSARTQDPASITGYWFGTLNVGGMGLRVAFHIKSGPDGALTVTMDSLDQGAKDIPAGPAALTGEKLTVDVPRVGGRYQGVFNAQAGTISGTWTQGGASLPLDLKRLDKPVVINRPQEPKKPFPYGEEEVSYPSLDGKFHLGGTLTIPKSGAPHPAVILISGSGAQDRDEMVFNHRPFLILSDHLTRLGVAVLRVDDRGVGKSGGDFASSTTMDFAGDVEAGLAFLRTRPEVDARRIGLIGHSEGGLIAPLAASRTSDLAFIVLLAGPGLVGEDILIRQSALISRASGEDEESIRRAGEGMKKLYSVLKSEKDAAAAEVKLRAAGEELYLSLSEKEKKEVGDKAVWLKALVANLNSPWFRFFLTYDPVPALEKVRCPVLALNGELDLQVPADANLEAIEKALRAGGNPDVLVKKLPGLNHLFQTAKTGSPAEYGSIEETMSPVALKAIGDWVSKFTARRP